MRRSARPTAPTAVAGAVLDLVERTRTGLLQACHATRADERYRLAHLAALRAAAAVLAADARRSAGSRPRNVWSVLPAVAPELSEWAAFFEGSAARRQLLERGAAEVSTREADDLVRQVETFLELVLTHLGLPMMESFTACVAPVPNVSGVGYPRVSEAV
ncbi:SAV_6107 family HEPN domain-containing protein [Flexivirga meconopsidis]|uniref:SAV_6107 family HEPN domain-containing protein n=1 Tax=Flexivirga meconopsidis TaxID=2977121 RepID=UPI00223FFB58|nr:SAV_6107 family HEPN domain-containing protein [Flexivirga meconopsidis]